MGIAIRLTAGLAMTVAMALAAGCNTELKAERDRLVSENEGLRYEKKRLEDELAVSRSELAGRDQTIAELRALANTQPPPFTSKPGPVAQAKTGFEGVEGEVSSGGGVVTVALPADLLFAPGKAAVKPSAKANIAKIASIIKSDYPGKKVRIRGHTDADPIRKSGWADNWDLGFNRAHAVAMALINAGVPKNSIEITSLADTEPRGAKARDRRVDVQVVVQDK